MDTIEDKMENIIEYDRLKEFYSFSFIIAQFLKLCPICHFWTCIQPAIFSAWALAILALLLFIFSNLIFCLPLVVSITSGRPKNWQ